MREAKTVTLLQSTSLIFALIAVLPLLTFAYALQRLDAIKQTEYQAALAFALAVALLGFGVFRSMMFRLSVLLRALNDASQKGPKAVSVAPTNVRLPAIGVVRELQRLPELVEQLSELWKAEAERYLGQPVLVSVKNSPVAIRGKLCQASDNGLLLERNGERQGITYRRVLSIEADSIARVAS
ncbi:MAG: hypothetical protein HY615_04235 [Candidatus Rokubacteria bacterium]|nr:hypothetical protein [Candidatus Rokubacteria bacterium]